MAKQRFAWSDSKGYTIKIFADTDQISYNPFEFETAGWEVTYDAQDVYSPGIVPSRMTIEAVLTTFPFAQSLEQVAKDAEGIFYLELWNGLSKEWAGTINPNGCTIEVINGARFMTIIASDGLHKLDLDSSMYSFAGYKSFIAQIGDIFTRVDLERLFDGIAVSDTTRRSANAVTKTYDGLYHTGSLHELFYYNDQKVYRTYRDIINEICVLFNLRMYQDRGFLVFQDFSRVTESEYSFYDMYGNYLTRRGFTSSQTLPVEAGGTKMYLPAVKQMDVIHEYGSTQFAFQSTLRTAEHNEFVATVGFTPVYQLKPGIPLGLYAGDGSTHFDFFDTQMRTVASFPGDYDSTYDIEFRLYLVYGTQSTNGTIWGSDLYMAFTESGRITAGGSPGIIAVVHNINNYHLPLTPVLGNSNVWLYLEVVQTTGDPLGLSKPTIKYDIRLDGTGETQTTYRADNTSRLMGEKLEYRTRLGDIPKGTPATQAILFTGGSNASDFVEVAGGPTQPLLFITANRMAQLRAQPREYYEINMRGTSRFTHYGYWGLYYYVPISLTYTWDECRATYAQFALDDLKSSALLVKNPTFELEA